MGWGVGLGEGEEPRGWAITIQDYASQRDPHQRSDRSTRYTQEEGTVLASSSKLSYIKVMPYGSGRHHIGYVFAVCLFVLARFLSPPAHNVGAFFASRLRAPSRAAQLQRTFG